MCLRLAASIHTHKHIALNNETTMPQHTFVDLHIFYMPEITSTHAHTHRRGFVCVMMTIGGPAQRRESGRVCGALSPLRLPAAVSCFRKSYISVCMKFN